VGKTKRGKGTKIMAIAAGNSVPVAIRIDSASPHESKLVAEILAGSFRNELCEKLIGDKAFDSNPLDRHLEDEYGIEMLGPNHENRSQPQDGRTLRRSERRWVADGCLPGCDVSADWSRATNLMRKISSAWSGAAA